MPCVRRIHHRFGRVPYHCARLSFDKESRRWNWLQEPLRVTKSKPSVIINEVDVEIRGMDKTRLIKVKRPDGSIGYREKEEPSLDLPVDLSTREGYESLPFRQRMEAAVQRQMSRKAHEALQAERAAKNSNRPPTPEPARPPTPKYYERYNIARTADVQPQKSNRRRKAEPTQDAPADCFRLRNGDAEGLVQLLEMINATASHSTSRRAASDVHSDQPSGPLPSPPRPQHTSVIPLVPTVILNEDGAVADEQPIRIVAPQPRIVSSIPPVPTVILNEDGAVVDDAMPLTPSPPLDFPAAPSAFGSRSLPSAGTQSQPSLASAQATASPSASEAACTSAAAPTSFAPAPEASVSASFSSASAAEMNDDIPSPFPVLQQRAFPPSTANASTFLTSTTTLQAAPTSFFASEPDIPSPFPDFSSVLPAFPSTSQAVPAAFFALDPPIFSPLPAFSMTFEPHIPVPFPEVLPAASPPSFTSPFSAPPATPLLSVSPALPVAPPFAVDPQHIEHLVSQCGSPAQVAHLVMDLASQIASRGAAYVHPEPPKVSLLYGAGGCEKRRRGRGGGGGGGSMMVQTGAPAPAQDGWWAEYGRVHAHAEGLRVEESGCVGVTCSRSSRRWRCEDDRRPIWENDSDTDASVSASEMDDELQSEARPLSSPHRPLDTDVS